MSYLEIISLDETGVTVSPIDHATKNRKVNQNGLH